MNHTEPIAILSNAHDLMRVAHDPKGYGDGADDTYSCTCGWECSADEVEEAFDHGRAVGYRLGRVEERSVIEMRFRRAIVAHPTGRMVDTDVGALIVPSPESNAELTAYRTGPLSPKKGRRA